MEVRLQFPPTPENGAVHAAIAVHAAWEKARVDLDYSVASLSRVDAILDDFHRRSVPVESLASILFAFGCYVGEVIVRHTKGEWIDVEKSGMKGFASFMVIQFPDGAECNPIGKVLKRVENGDEDSIPYFYHVFAAKRSVRSWWKVW